MYMTCWFNFTFLSVSFSSPLVHFFQFSPHSLSSCTLFYFLLLQPLPYLLSIRALMTPSTKPHRLQSILETPFHPSTTLADKRATCIQQLYYILCQRGGWKTSLRNMKKEMWNNEEWEIRGYHRSAFKASENAKKALETYRKTKAD